MIKMPREPGLTCKCGAFPMNARHHGILHGHPPDPKTGRPHKNGPQLNHTVDACDHDPLALSHKAAHEFMRKHKRRPTWFDLNPDRKVYQVKPMPSPVTKVNGLPCVAPLL